MTVTYAPVPESIGGGAVSPIYRPRSAVFWLYTVALVIGVFTISTERGPAFGATLETQIELAWMWVAFVVLIVWLIFRFDPYRSGRAYPQILVAGLALGGTTALTMAADANTAMDGVNSRWLDPEAMASWSAALSAPFIEEASKGLCALLVLVLCKPVFSRLSQAMMLGMFVGLGFDLTEDLDYAANDALASLDTDYDAVHDELMIRFITAVPAHWAYTALATMGVLILLPWFDNLGRWSRPKRVLVAVSLMASASLMHFLWDAPPFADTDNADMIIKVALNTVIFLIPVLLLMRLERQWVQGRIDTGRTTFLAGFDSAVLDSLLTWRSRVDLRRTARRDGGRAAARAVRHEQKRALSTVQTGWLRSPDRGRAPAPSA
jgi:RsiW-degrading membrane proteinase PrsW (M82 family)